MFSSVRIPRKGHLRDMHVRYYTCYDKSLQWADIIHAQINSVWLYDVVDIPRCVFTYLQSGKLKPDTTQEMLLAVGYISTEN
jgi:hypothetical protein